MKLLSAFVVALAMIVGAPLAGAEPVARVAFHVDEKDPKKMNITLNNAMNVYKYYEARGEEVEIAIVANGPGLHMFRADSSPVKDRISVMALEVPGIQFQACANTAAVMAKQENGVEPKLVEEAKWVPSGVIQLMMLQKDGWAYIKP